MPELTCPTCSKLLVDTWNFCPDCGTPSPLPRAEPESQPRDEGSDGALDLGGGPSPGLLGQEFCSRCGVRLHSGAGAGVWTPQPLNPAPGENFCTDCGRLQIAPEPGDTHIITIRLNLAYPDVLMGDPETLAEAQHVVDACVRSAALSGWEPAGSTDAATLLADPIVGKGWSHGQVLGVRLRMRRR